MIKLKLLKKYILNPLQYGHRTIKPSKAPIRKKRNFIVS